MIELRQLVGKYRDRAGQIVEVQHPIDEVIRDGKRVAWLARHAGARVCFLNGVNPAEFDDIRSECNKLRGGELGEGVSKPPVIPPELIEQDDDGGDEDE